MLASLTTHDGTLRLWDAADGSLIAVIFPTAETMPTHLHWSPDGVHLAWSPDGRYLVAGGGRTLDIWTRQGVLARRHGMGEPLHDLGVPDDGTIRVANAEALLTLEPATGRVLASLPGVRDDVPKFDAVAWSRDGRYHAMTHDDGVVFIHDHTGEPVGEPLVTDQSRKRVRLSHDGSRLMLWMESGSVKIIDVASRETVVTEALQHWHIRNPLSLTGDGEGLLMLHGPGPAKALRELREGGLRQIVNGRAAAIDNYNAGVTALAASPDGRLVAMGRTHGSVMIREAEDGKRVSPAPSLVAGMQSVVTAEGWVAVGAVGRVWLWSPLTDEVRELRSPEANLRHRGVAITGDARFVLARPYTRPNQHGVVWSVESGEAIHRPALKDDLRHAFLPGAMRLVGPPSDPGRFPVVDASTGALVRELTVADGEEHIAEVLPAPDGRHGLFVLGRRSGFLIARLDDGQVVGRLDLPDYHLGAAAWSSDGEHIMVIENYNHKASVVDLNGREVERFRADRVLDRYADGEQAWVPVAMPQGPVGVEGVPGRYALPLGDGKHFVTSGHEFTAGGVHLYAGPNASDHLATLLTDDDGRWVIIKADGTLLGDPATAGGLLAAGVGLDGKPTLTPFPEMIKRLSGPEAETDGE